ncbi:hypothetical protein [Dermatophilus congolensis]|uniref:hypothetical protein n=1 Tax=Dermatophilus congolensis TaxID=1863 RepID=UPI001AAF7201|nr:hypothetical protein [Dermatophilus congolensis]MBO3129995.1 hypothetical protein [Dermatophilus congolensis]MBO3131375.1 hypothetical protein [Dermatophilus congolensis]MBO3134469.1 hypothetical protein [Dermatophilus congolensis]MBO3136704.1 hypothetical protein [Dermatophilus congolensis]MBO3138949.1 hypothetical protein [Dermatophilus congolensis]
MPKFTTPYDTLLRVRRIEEDKAKAALAAANAEHRAALARLDSTRQAHRDAMNKSHGETDINGFMREALHGQRLAQSIMWASYEAEKADTTRQTALGHVTKASQRTQGLERLVERAKEERFERMLAADQQVAEESNAGVRARKAAAEAARRAARTQHHPETPHDTHEQYTRGA